MIIYTFLATDARHDNGYAMAIIRAFDLRNARQLLNQTSKASNRALTWKLVEEKDENEHGSFIIYEDIQ
mgnify:CR=1 FL=1